MLFRVTSYQNINKRDYYTISTSGCTHFVGDEVEMTTLERFEREYRLFLSMRKVSYLKLTFIYERFNLWLY